nr:synapsin-1 [Oryctolagus cuniculus]
MAPTEPGTGEAPSGKAQSTGQAPSGRLPAEDASLPVYEWERTGEPLGHFQGDSRRSAAVPSAGAALTPRETCLAPPPPGLCTLSPHSGRRPPGVPAPSPKVRPVTARQSWPPRPHRVAGPALFRTYPQRLQASPELSSHWDAEAGRRAAPGPRASGLRRGPLPAHPGRPAGRRLHLRPRSSSGTPPAALAAAAGGT